MFVCLFFSSLCLSFFFQSIAFVCLFICSWEVILSVFSFFTFLLPLNTLSFLLLLPSASCGVLYQAAAAAAAEAAAAAVVQGVEALLLLRV